MSAEKERSVMWIVLMLMLVVAAFGWAFAAAGYAHSEEDWRGETISERVEADGERPSGGMRRNASKSLVDFAFNAIEQLSNLPQVLSFTFKNRLWLPIVVGVLEVLLIVGGVGMKRIEKELSQPAGRRRGRA